MARADQPAMHPAIHVPADDYLDARSLVRAPAPVGDPELTDHEFCLFEQIADIKYIKGEVYIKGYLRDVHAALVRANPHKYEIINAEFRHLNLGSSDRFKDLAR